MLNILTYTDDELLNAYDTYSTLMARGVRDEIYLTQVENELNRRGINYKFEDILMDLFKQVNEVFQPFFPDKFLQRQADKLFLCFHV